MNSGMITVGFINTILMRLDTITIVPMVIRGTSMSVINAGVAGEMIRYRTLKQDVEIFLRIAAGEEPKNVWKALNLSSESVVYNAFRRCKKNKQFYMEQLNKIGQIENLDEFIKAI